jgi:histidinol-phosphate aminotransferase
MTDHLWKIKQPYNLNVAADAAARASLADLDWLRGNIAKLQAERDRLYEALQASALLDPYPSRANFLLCRVSGMEGHTLKAALEAEGILVRYFDKPGLRDHIRISAGKPEHSDALLAALERIEKDVT